MSEVNYPTDILVVDGMGVSVEETMEIIKAHKEGYGPNSFHDVPFDIYIIKKLEVPIYEILC